MDIPLAERIIEDALKIIEDPNRWTRGAEARDKDGEVCDVLSRRAKRFCARGALEKAAHRHKADYYDIVGVIGTASPYYTSVNDSPDGRRKVIKIFKKALKSLRA